jgi:hypothetical protein
MVRALFDLERPHDRLNKQYLKKVWDEVYSRMHSLLETDLFHETNEAWPKSFLYHSEMHRSNFSMAGKARALGTNLAGSSNSRLDSASNSHRESCSCRNSSSETDMGIGWERNNPTDMDMCFANYMGMCKFEGYTNPEHKVPGKEKDTEFDNQLHLRTR